MESINNPSTESVRETDFDQSVDELKQLENEERKKPDNEKIKQYLKEVRAHIDSILSELDSDDGIKEDVLPTADTKPIPHPNPNPNSGRGEGTLNAYRSTQQDSGVKYVDSQGFTHSSPDDAKDNPDNWRVANA